MTAADMHRHVWELEDAWAEAARTGKGDSDALLVELETCREAYVGLAVTEIAILREELSGPQVG